jgi:hypothetical protein
MSRRGSTKEIPADGISMVYRRLFILACVGIIVLAAVCIIQGRVIAEQMVNTDYLMRHCGSSR